MLGTMLFVPPAAVAAVSTLQAQQSAGTQARVTQRAGNPPAGAEAGEQQEIVVSARARMPGDPLEKVNALSFAVTNQIDDAVTAPASRVYAHVVPKPVRHGLRNFFANLGEPVVFANYLLQLKPGKAFETAGRFAINTTVGLGGTLDVAVRCPFNLPRRQNGFSDTLGFYGVKPGPFLFVPVAGPTTVRDVVGGLVDFFASPAMIGGPFRSRAYVISSATVRILDRRDRKEAMLDGVRKSDDPYATRRNLYLQRQRERVEALHGEGPPAPPPHRCRRREVSR
ncbi:phospholipid-binding lipoprotein MlaA [Sphingomonas trueperi]|uniref:MlaA family lipoprotein n=1 Tax=Sphingomonas trueperi TaxID=53317 RepID=UPI00339A7ECB